MYNYAPSALPAVKAADYGEIKKIFCDGQVLILREDRLYDLRGQEVK